MRRSLSWALGLGAFLSGPAGVALGQQWFFYPTNAPAAQATAYPYSVPADFPRPYGPAPQAPQPTASPYRMGPGGPMPQTVYYPMPNQMAGPMMPAMMPPAPMPAPVQRAADVTPAPLPAAGAPIVSPAPAVLQGPVMPETVPMESMTMPTPTGYAGMPASIGAADVAGDSPTPRTGWMGGATLYLLKPYVNDNVAFTTTTVTAAPTTNPITGLPEVNTSVGRNSTEFDYDLSASPGAWIGYLGPRGFGWRADFFHFDQTARSLNSTLTGAEATTPISSTAIAAPTTITAALPGAAGFGAPTAVTASDVSGTGFDTLSFGSELKVEYYDLEAACDFQLGRCWSLLVTAGGRYLHMAENYGGLISGVGAPPGGTALATETQILTFGHNFVGGGPTLMLQARWARPDSHLAFFSSARGSLVVGRSRQDYFFSDTITNPSATAFLPSGTLTSTFDDRRDWVIPITEIEIGVEYALNVYHTRPFIRAAAINQTYFGFGSASRTDTDLGLFGAEFSLGVDY